jgi:hydrogenase/urease accessory protein HupE
MARAIQNSAHPREGGDPGVLRFRGSTRTLDAGRIAATKKAWVPAFAGMSAVLGALIPTLAFAHPGDHSHMALAVGVGHLLTEPDHLATLLAGVVGLLAAAWVARTQRAR